MPGIDFRKPSSDSGSVCVKEKDTTVLKKSFRKPAHCCKYCVMGNICVIYNICLYNLHIFLKPGDKRVSPIEACTYITYESITNAPEEPAEEPEETQNPRSVNKER